MMASEDVEYVLESDDEQDCEEMSSNYDEEDYGFEYSGADGDSPTSKSSQMNYTIISDDMIVKRQKDAMRDVAGVLSISLSDAAILLRHFKWSVSRVEDEWFQDEENVRKAVGLSSSSLLHQASNTQLHVQLVCEICFESFNQEEMEAPACKKHYFCRSCWKGYIGNAIKEGPGCLTLRCPDPACGGAVGEDMVRLLVSSELHAKYLRYRIRSYVEDNTLIKWCPAPGCEHAAEFVAGSSSFDIVCNCSYMFCWNCLEEGHRPVDCETVEKWIRKNSAESENMNWILANSKPCPKCKRPIEKNQGCMHMSCTPPCKHEFCWLCLGDWNDHGERTGGFYACNKYESAKTDGAYAETERRRTMAKNLLERYTHYYERWATNDQSRVKALEGLHQMQAEKIEKLSEIQKLPVSQLKFVLEALQQIVECRRVLKWTYAYGYYLLEDEHAKRQFFEYLQGEAESALERLHTCAEKELEGYFEQEDAHEFGGFRAKLAGLTSVTRTYFENLVSALENGLDDVQSLPHTSNFKTKVTKRSGRSVSSPGGSGKS